MLATNETHPVREFVERAFKFVKIDIQWQGEKGTVSEARPVHPWPLCLYTVCIYCMCRMFVGSTPLLLSHVLP